MSAGGGAGSSPKRRHSALGQMTVNWALGTNELAVVTKKGQSAGAGPAKTKAAPDETPGAHRKRPRRSDEVEAAGERTGQRPRAQAPPSSAPAPADGATVAQPAKATVAKASKVQVEGKAKSKGVGGGEKKGASKAGRPRTGEPPKVRTAAPSAAPAPAARASAAKAVMVLKRPARKAIKGARKGEKGASRPGPGAKEEGHVVERIVGRFDAEHGEQKQVFYRVQVPCGEEWVLKEDCFCKDLIDKFEVERKATEKQGARLVQERLAARSEITWADPKSPGKTRKYKMRLVRFKDGSVEWMERSQLKSQLNP